MDRLKSTLGPLYGLVSPPLQKRTAGYIADYLNHRRDMRHLRQYGLDELPELPPPALRMLRTQFEKERGGANPSAGLALLAGLVGAAAGVAACWVYFTRKGS